MSEARRSPTSSARGRSRVDGTLDAEAFAAAIQDDAVSYAAGLSRMRFWRFALATLAGIVPTSFLPERFGSVAMEGEAGAITWILAIRLGILTSALLVWAAPRGANRRKKQKRAWR
jgi:uncharacterized membrane protein YdjX (TVP38/TMEM64 family)